MRQSISLQFIFDYISTQLSVDRITRSNSAILCIHPHLLSQGPNISHNSDSRGVFEPSRSVFSTEDAMLAASTPNQNSTTDARGEGEELAGDSSTHEEVGIHSVAAEDRVGDAAHAEGGSC